MLFLVFVGYYFTYFWGPGSSNHTKFLLLCDVHMYNVQTLGPNLDVIYRLGAIAKVSSILQVGIRHVGVKGWEDWVSEG